MPSPEEIGLPVRPFMYTHDQIENILSMNRPALQRVSYYEGASIHLHSPDLMRWVNLAVEGEPMWRLEEKELIRWCKRRGIRVRDSSWARKSPAR